MDATRTHTTSSRSTNPTGKRRDTDVFRRALERAEAAREAGGLPQGVSPYALLDTLDGLCRHTEWTTDLVRTLKLLMRPIPLRDWHRGKPVNYRPVTDLATELGISTRGFRYRVNRLMELGAVAFRDAPNYHRYRTPTDAGGEGDTFGIDLAPCILLHDEAKASLAELHAEHNAHKRLRHRVSALRSQVRALLLDPRNRETLGDDVRPLDADLEALDPGRLDRLAGAVLEALTDRFTALLTRCRALLEAVTVAVERAVETPLTEGLQDNDSFRQSGTRFPPVSTHTTDPVPPYSCSPSDIDHNHRTDAVQASSAQLVEALPRALARLLPVDKRIAGTVDIQDLIAACRLYRPRLDISRHAWDEAQRLIGPVRSAMVLVITAARSAETWPEERRVHSPGGFFRALSRLVHAGEADLRGSIHGIVAHHLGPRFDRQTG